MTERSAGCGKTKLNQLSNNKYVFSLGDLVLLRLAGYTNPEPLPSFRLTPASFSLFYPQTTTVGLVIYVDKEHMLCLCFTKNKFVRAKRR